MSIAVNFHKFSLENADQRHWRFDLQFNRVTSFVDRHNYVSPEEWRSLWARTPVRKKEKREKEKAKKRKSEKMKEIKRKKDIKEINFHFRIYQRKCLQSSKCELHRPQLFESSGNDARQ